MAMELGSKWEHSHAIVSGIQTRSADGQVDIPRLVGRNVGAQSMVEYRRVRGGND